MSTTTLIFLALPAVGFLLLMGVLLWWIERGKRQDPQAKTGTFGGSPFAGGTAGDGDDKSSRGGDKESDGG